MVQATWLTPKILVYISEFQQTCDLEKDDDAGKQLFQKLNIQQDFWRCQFAAFMLNEKIPLNSTGKFCIKEGYPMYVLKKIVLEIFPALPNIFAFTRAPLVKDISVIILDELPSPSMVKDEKLILDALNKYGHPLVGRQDWASQGVLRFPICLTAQNKSCLNSHYMDNPAAIAVPLWEVGVARALKKLLDEMHYSVPILAIKTKRFVELHLLPIRKDHRIFYAKQSFVEKNFFGEINKVLTEMGRPKIRW